MVESIQTQRQRARLKIRMQSAALCAVILVIMALFLFPIYLAVITSFKTKLEVAQNVFALPATISFTNYTEAMRLSNFVRSLMNSFITTFPSVTLLVLFASMGGYAIARHGARRRLIRWMDKVYLAALMIPFQILMIPVYKLFRTLGLQNNLYGMIVILTGHSMAYSTFLYVGFVKGVPRELEEAAYVDGAAPLRAFLQIVFPILQPITATVAALHLMWHWNDFNISMILLQKDSVRTLTVKQFYFFGEYTSEYPMAFAAAILSMVPVITMFLIMQKYIISGIAAGSVKS